MLPSLSKHFIKELYKPLIRGATQEEIYWVKPHEPMSMEAEVEWRTFLLTEPFKRRPHIHRLMDQPQRNTP